MTISHLAGRAALGAYAENLAARFLEDRGFRILQRNWRRPAGEVDLVAEDHGILVFVEVRSRIGDEHGHPVETVNIRKRRRIVRAARLYLQESPRIWNDSRFDVVGITFSQESTPPALLYIEDAFRVS